MQRQYFPYNERGKDTFKYSWWTIKGTITVLDVRVANEWTTIIPYEVIESLLRTIFDLR